MACKGTCKGCTNKLTNDVSEDALKTPGRFDAIQSTAMGVSDLWQVVTLRRQSFESGNVPFEGAVREHFEKETKALQESVEQNAGFSKVTIRQPKI